MDQRKALPHLPPVLRAMAEEGRLVHSLCLEGEPGSGRTDLATALAGAILCQRQQGEMCGECLHCRKVLAGVHSDITLVNGREDPDRFKVEALRQLRAEAHRGPSEGRAKVYILAEAQHLLPPAQNLLLKILEEPPEATFFILTCDNKFRLLPTILSRVVTVSLRPLPLQACAQLQEERLPGHAPAEYQEAALLCCGNPGEGEQILTQPQAAKKGRAAQSLVAAMAAGEPYGILAVATPWEKNRGDYAALLEQASRLVMLPEMQGQLGLSPAAAASIRRRLALAEERNRQNGYLPLLTALLSTKKR